MEKSVLRALNLSIPSLVSDRSDRSIVSCRMNRARSIKTPEAQPVTAGPAQM
jgi:hypothetical protein